MREPTNDEQRLMIVGGFETLEDYLQWMNTPLTDDEEFELEKPDFEEIVLREMGCFHSGCSDDNNPDVLADLRWRADLWLEENERRELLKIDRKL